MEHQPNITEARIALGIQPNPFGAMHIIDHENAKKHPKRKHWRPLCRKKDKRKDPEIYDSFNQKVLDAGVLPGDCCPECWKILMGHDAIDEAYIL